MRKILSVMIVISLLASVYTPAAAESDEEGFKGFSDPAFVEYVEESVYQELVENLDSDDYFVEDIKVSYRSQHYMEMQEFNSKEPLYFGYKLSELNERFDGQKYVFTLGENNQTVAIPFEAYDSTYDPAFRNLAIGAGIIIIEVVVSVVASAMGQTEIAMTFAMAAEQATKSAVKKALTGGIMAALITGYETSNINMAVESGLLAASEGFKWGAIVGSVEGAAKEIKGLNQFGADKNNGLSKEDAARIQQRSRLPLEFIKSFHSVEEYEIYEKAGLSATKIGGNMAYSRLIDLNSIIQDQYGRNMTNAERIRQGFSPVDSTGVPYELHHIGQLDNAPLAILTKAEHMQGGNNKILHWRTDSDVNHGSQWSKIVSNFWTNYLSTYGGA